MVGYILKRLLMIIPTLLAVVVIIFTLLYFAPGDPATIAASGRQLTEEQLDAIRESMGLNKTYIEQLGEYILNIVLHFDFGYSYTDGTAVGPELVNRLLTTFKIALIGIILMILIGIPIGVTSAVHANKTFDRVAMFITLIGNSMPLFWLGIMLALVFSLKLKWLPSNGSSTPLHFIMPCLCVSFEGISGISRQTRSSMLEVIRSEYVTTARAKGLTERKVIYKHALLNALVPIITVISNQFGRLIGGVVVVESIFSIRGLSVYLLNGINNRDYTVVMGSLLVIAFMFSIIMLVADLVYIAVDPRQKSLLSHPKKKKNGGSENEQK